MDLKASVLPTTPQHPKQAVIDLLQKTSVQSKTFIISIGPISFYNPELSSCQARALYDRVDRQCLKKVYAMKTAGTGTQRNRVSDLYSL